MCFFCNEYLPQITPIIPESTYLIWLDCRKTGMKGDDLKDFFIKKARVGFNDGRLFGTGGGEGFMRINVACPRSVVLEALQRIKKMPFNIFKALIEKTEIQDVKLNL